MEEAWFQTLALRQGLTVKGGRFRSGIGYQNEQHPHAWDFATNNLMYEALFGEGYGNDGLQLRWVAPTDLFTELGAEIGRGANFPGTDRNTNGIGNYALYGHIGGDVGDSHSWRGGVSYLSTRAKARSGKLVDFAGIDTALQLSGKTVCAQTGTTSELNLSDYFRANDMTLKVATFATAEESRKAYDDRKCDVLTSDVSQLYAERLKLTAPDSHMILPEVISKEPLGPVVRQGDDQWFNLVKWTLYSLINAEELGVKSSTIDSAMQSSHPDIRRLVGTEGEFGVQLGLSKDWAANAIRAVGNYGEIYERNVGTQSQLSIPRGLNALWTRGGIQYAPPVR